VEVMKSPYLLLICVHVLLLSLTNTFLYFQQASIVAGAFDSPAERTRRITEHVFREWVRLEHGAVKINQQNADRRIQERVIQAR